MELADIEQHLHGTPLRDHLQVEPAFFGCRADRGWQVELGGGALAGDRRSRRNATLMLRVPSSTSASRLRNSRLSQTFTARLCRFSSWPMRTPSGL